MDQADLVGAYIQEAGKGEETPVVAVAGLTANKPGLESIQGLQRKVPQATWDFSDLIQASKGDLHNGRTEVEVAVTVEELAEVGRVDVFCAEVEEGYDRYVMVNLQGKNEILRHATEIQMQALCQGCPIPHHHCSLDGCEGNGGIPME